MHYFNKIANEINHRCFCPKDYSVFLLQFIYGTTHKFVENLISIFCKNFELIYFFVIE